MISRAERIRDWKWCMANPDHKKDSLAIPMRIKDFKNTPPTLVLVGEHDPLRDEGIQLAENMKVAAIHTETLFFKEMPHGFMHMGAILKEAILAIAAFTKENSK